MKDQGGGHIACANEGGWEEISSWGDALNRGIPEPGITEEPKSTEEALGKIPNPSSS